MIRLRYPSASGLNCGWVPVLGLVDIDKAKVSTASKLWLFSRQFFSPVENHTDVFSFGVHPFLGVESNESWDEGEYSVVTAHTNLFKNGWDHTINVLKEKEQTNMLSRVELGASLPNNDVSWNYKLVWRSNTALTVDFNYRRNSGSKPENFFTPRRFPGECPWLRTVPPARLVAVLTEPTPVYFFFANCKEVIMIN